MNNIAIYSIMAKPIAEQRPNRRERIQLTSPGLWLRSLASEFRGAIATFERSLSVATEEATFCNFNPAECRGVA